MVPSKAIHGSQDMRDLHTDPAILRALRAAVGRELTPEEVEQQRISFVLGSLKHDSSVTRPQIRTILARQAGRKTPA